MDFTSLLDGTIDGRLDFSAAHGAFRFDPALLDTRTYSPNYIGPHPVSLLDVTPDGGFWAARGDFDWMRDVQVDVTPRGGQEHGGLRRCPSPARCRSWRPVSWRGFSAFAAHGGCARGT